MRRLEVKIDRPCSEKWESFENSFCEKCHKTIVDFRSMDKSEILLYLRKSDVRVCGIVKKAITQKKVTAKRGFMIHSVFVFSSLFIGIKDSFSQKTTQPISIVGENIPNANTNIIGMTKDEDQKIIVHGIVTDDTGEALPGVSIVKKGTTEGTQTDLDGKYRIEATKSVTLIFSFVGFETQEIKVGSRTHIDIIMSGATELGEVIVISKWYTPRGLWQRIKNIF